MASSNYCSEGDIIIWQEDNDLGETAIQVCRYDNGVTLIQDGEVINISFATFNELFKVIRKLKEKTK